MYFYFNWINYKLIQFIWDVYFYNTGVFANVVWRFKQSETELLYKIEGETEFNEYYVRTKLKGEFPDTVENGNNLYHESYYESLLNTYFRLDVDLPNLYEKWSKAHQHFSNSAKQFSAVRVLNQDPVENLVSFICSQNNNIKRISKMIHQVCETYGDKICTVDDQLYCTFPDISKLADSKVNMLIFNVQKV